mmetsp:Transcript_32976/g.38382  ORF Transcript_32976/g.38382 Transcript_32976/m.38382 type:complete len:216 (+) Transcript_32976:59-706(+)
MLKTFQLIAAVAVFLTTGSKASAFVFSRKPTANSPKTTSLRMGLLDFLGLGEKRFDGPCLLGDESIMSPKAHGTSETPVQENLRWDCDEKVADNICNFNRHYAEFRGYWKSTNFIEEAKKEYAEKGEIKFYDSNTGKLLFVAPKGRSFEDFMKESLSHGWPSFRDEEVVWDDVRCLKNGEAVSLAGTHLGHNLPDFSGNRYCINLVSVAGNPVEN